MRWYSRNSTTGTSEPLWQLAMTPVAIDCNYVPGAMWQGRMGLIAGDGAMVIAFDQSFDETRSGEDLVLGIDISGTQAALTSTRGTRRKPRHYFYSMDTDGNEVVLEFRSEIEARVLATWTNENCSGKQEWEVMPLNLWLVPLRIDSWRRKRWWETERASSPRPSSDVLKQPRTF